MSSERILSQDYDINPTAPPFPAFAPNSSDSQSSYDVVKLLSLLQQVNPTRSALMQQLHQLMLYIEQDKRLTQDEKDVILNTELRGTIKKLEDDYNNRGFNRPNCPLRRDLMFHYANLFMKYQEMTDAKKTLSRQSIYNPPPVVTAIPEAIAIEDTETNRPSARQRNTGVRSNNTFNSRMESQRDQNERVRQSKATGDAVVLLMIIAFLYFLYKKLF